MNSIQVSIQADEDRQEILISQLTDLGVVGFEQTDTTLLAYFNESNYPNREVNDLLTNDITSIKTIAEKNWNEEWEKNFQPVIVADFCGIRAEFHNPILNVSHEIIITPKMSFGTGHHATTFMMIEQMRAIEFKGKNVFDFGTGTGILAILAEKLGAEKIMAIDVDEWSITNGSENVQRNGCRRIELEQTTDLPSDTFDVILANINKNVILEYLPALKYILNPGGKILFSGLLKNDEQDVTQASLRLGLKSIIQKEKDNWISLLFVN